MEEQGRYGVVNEGRGYTSKAEVQIARLLEKNNITYRYEQPVAVIDRGKTRLWYPDFYLPDYAVVIEYFGVNGDTSYDNRTKHKIEVYKKSGIEGLFLTEASLRGDWSERILGQIEEILRNRLDEFYNRRCRGRRG